jgi:hypothetical protein
MSKKTLKIVLEKKEEEEIKYGCNYLYYKRKAEIERIRAMRGSISEEEYNELMIEAVLRFLDTPVTNTGPPKPPVMPKYEGLKDEKTEKVK